MKNHLTHATTFEYEASVFGASFIAFGLGILLQQYFNQTWAIVIMAIGLVLHAWGMFRVNKRNN